MAHRDTPPEGMDDSPTQRDSWEGAPKTVCPRPRGRSNHEELTQSRSSATQYRHKLDSATTTKTRHQKEWTTALPREAHGTAHQDPRPRGRSNHEEFTQSRSSATQHRDKPDSATTTAGEAKTWHPTKMWYECSQSRAESRSGEKAAVTQRLDERSYQVETDDGSNRVHLKKTGERSPILVTTQYLMSFTTRHSQRLTNPHRPPSWHPVNPDHWQRPGWKRSRGLGEHRPKKHTVRRGFPDSFFSVG